MIAPTAATSDGLSPGPAGWSVRVERPHSSVAHLTVSLSDYREHFTVIAGERQLAVVRLDTSTGLHAEPEVFVFAKPYEWNMQVSDEELVVQVWQSVGVQR